MTALTNEELLKLCTDTIMSEAMNELKGICPGSDKRLALKLARALRDHLRTQTPQAVTREQIARKDELEIAKHILGLIFPKANDADFSMFVQRHGVHIAAIIRADRDTEKSAPTPTLQDAPELDATDFAHPAWWRGHIHGTDGSVRAIESYFIEDRIAGVVNHEGLRKLRERIHVMRAPTPTPLTEEERYRLFTTITQFCCEDASVELNRAFRPEFVWKLVERLSASPTAQKGEA